MKNNVLYKKLLQEYDLIQQNADNVLNKKKLKCFEICPRIKEIDDELNLTGIRITKSILVSNPKERELYLQEIKDVIHKLTNEKNLILEQYGFGIDYFEKKYMCNKCQDTGFINSEMCICFKQKMIYEYSKKFDFMKILKDADFNNFSLDYYPNKLQSSKFNNSQNITDTPYVYMERNLNKAKLFIKEFNKDNKTIKNLFLTGSPGLGKSFLSQCISKEILNKGYSVIYISSFNMFQLYEKKQFNKEISDIELEILDMISYVDLLVIDDLGTELYSYSTNTLLNIIEHRITCKKSMIITSNLSGNDIKNQYSDRVLSRILGDYSILKFIGDEKKSDIRIIKASQKNNNRNNIE